MNHVTGISYEQKSNLIDVPQTDPSSKGCSFICSLNFALEDIHLRITKIFSAFVIALSAALEAEGYFQHALPDNIYYIGGGIGFIAFIVYIFSSCCFCQKLERQPVRLIGPEEINQLGFAPYIHELCERTINGSPQECTIQRLNEIVDLLKNRKALKVLNTIPEYFISNCYQNSALDQPEPLYTPLQYWAARGNLDAVRILYKHGAADYCYSHENIDEIVKSALYVSVLEGHENVVDFLLQQGASCSIAFDNNILFSFIPFLVFEMCVNNRVNAMNLNCLEKVLSHLQCKLPEELVKQLRIPLYSTERVTENCLAFIQCKQPSNFLQLLSLLMKFGGSETDALSLAQLKEEGNDIGNGLTLGVMHSYK